MTKEEQRIFILVDNIKNNCYEVAEKLLEDFKKEIRADAIDEYAKLVWEDIEARYKNDIKVLGYLSAENLLRDVHNSICYFAKQLKEMKND